MSEQPDYQVGDRVRVTQITWLEDDDTPEYAALLRSLIGCVGVVVATNEYHDYPIVTVETSDGNKRQVALCNEEIELVHRPAPQEQIPLLEVES